ncbi:CoA transferase [Streptomyces sp. NPDC050625]|uniref:CaiB/BaiF CoA transferase family protein n=1 Tax=Streptomyces sp. NPDC050625 TaxID=3154629 RepID=UPI00342DE70B
MSDIAASHGVLNGVRVVELCHLIAGPYCGQLLADEGADVVKIEPPQGEATRHREPIRHAEEGSVSGYYAALNRRKRSVVLDLKSKAGIDTLHCLLETADVFTTNMRPQALDRLGIHPHTIRERYPRLVVAVMTGFGIENTGEDGNRAGLAMVAEALAGTNSLTRDREGRATWVGFAMGDVLTGMTAHAAILLALRHQDRTGEGRLIDCSLTESTLPMTAVALSRAQFVDPAVAAQTGNQDLHGIPYGTFEAADGAFNIGVNNDVMWARLCRAMGRDELAEDKRYAKFLERATRRQEVVDLVESWSRTLPREQVIEAILAQDVPTAPVLTLNEVLESKHFAAREAFVEVDDGLGGTIRLPTDPTGFAIAAPARVPRVGEQRDEVLHELGLSDEEIAALASDGAFGA